MRLLFPDPVPARAPHPPIRWNDRGLWGLLAGALLLQLFALSRVEGYQVADAVEYMIRASRVVDGETLDPRAGRPFVFSALMMPLFRAADALELESRAALVGVMRAVQMLVGLAAVWVTARIGARMGGRAFGLVAGAFLAANVSFVRYTITPVADPEAMLFLALAVETLLRGRERKHGFATGLLLGTATLFAYKSIALAGALLAGLFLRERLRHPGWLLSVAGGLAACLVVGSTVDALAYGQWGSSIDGYLQRNVFGVLSRLLFLAGFEDAGRWVYVELIGVERIDQAAHAAGDIRAMASDTWYVDNLHVQLLSWPLLALLAAGVLSALRRPRYPQALLLCVTAFSFLLFSNKGAKDYRLFLPVLPMISVLGAVGWRAVRGDTTVAPEGNLVRKLAAGGALAAGVLLAPVLVARLNLKEHGGYWRAMEIVNAAAAEERQELRARGLEAPPRRVASAYDWAVAMRETRDVDLVRMPMELIHYVRRSEHEEFDAARAETLETIAGCDWFVAHLQLLWQSPEIMEVVGGTFEIHALLYDAEAYGGLAPICVLRRRTGEPGARTFFDVLPDVGPEGLAAYRRTVQHPVGLRFRGELPDGGHQEVELVGWDVETGLGGGDLAWFTYHWYARTGGAEDFAIFDRVTDADGAAGLAGLGAHRPAYAVHDTSAWKAGSVVRESYPRLMPLEPGAFGGAHRRGDLLPATLWMAIRRGVPGEPGSNELVPWDAERDRPLRPGTAPAGEDSFRRTGDGWFWDAEGRIGVGGCWLPVPPDMRVPDDGRPLPVLEEP